MELIFSGDGDDEALLAIAGEGSEEVRPPHYQLSFPLPFAAKG